MKWLLRLFSGRRTTPVWRPQPQLPRPKAPTSTPPAPRVLLGFRDGSAVELDARSDAARSLQVLALSLRTGLDAPSLGLHRGPFSAENS